VEAVVSFLTRRSSGGYAHRDVDVSTAVVRVGRGADSEVYLPDPRVPLRAAAITVEPGGVFIEAAGPLDVRINGAPASRAKLNVGDKLTVGPYDLEVVEPPAGKDFMVTVEMVRPLGDQLEQLKARSRTRLESTWLSKRRTSWALFLVLAALFLAAPIAWSLMSPAPAGMARIDQRQAALTLPPDKPWDSGAISSSHKFFANDCKSCHEKPFQQVRDSACLTCHGSINHHGEPELFTQASLALPACQSCHKEHNGDAGIVLSRQALCTDCHADLKSRAPATGLLNASDFAKDHPQFRPTVVVDHAQRKLERISLSEPGKLKESGGVRFPHDKHLTRENGGLRAPDGRRVMECGDCHVLEAGGMGMQPIRMETHCAECHQLNFEARDPLRTVPHGKPAEVQAILKDFYAKVALEGGFDDPNAPAAVRRLPGTPLAPEARADALAWAKARADEAISTAFGKQLCGYCHAVTQGAGGAWDVVKPMLADRWMTEGKFHHKSHEAVECGECHAATASKEASDVLLPGIAKCQSCHGGEQASAKVPSACIMCHDFHNPAFPPMKAMKATMAKSGGG
jgi:predicted CXXCH cytochrome family protein